MPSLSRARREDLPNGFAFGGAAYTKVPSGPQLGFIESWKARSLSFILEVS